MSIRENRAADAVDKAIRQYQQEMRSSMEALRIFKNKSFEDIDEKFSSIMKYSDALWSDEKQKVKKLKKQIAKYKELLITLCLTLMKDYERDRDSRSTQNASQCLYYLNTIRFNDSTNLYEEPIAVRADGCIAGSLQNVFGESCYVFGTEGEADRAFTGHQGNNSFGMQNDCGIACVAQLLILSGKKVTENDVVRVAIGEGLCNITDTTMATNGATSAAHRAALLEKYHIKSRIEIAESKAIASYIEHGHGVIVSVDAGLLWNRESERGIGHAIVLYGTIHRASDGVLMGFVVCDTGAGTMKRYLSRFDFERMFYYDRGINVTLEAIR